MIFINPSSSFNPFPPGPRGPVTPTFTVTPMELPATWTASPTLELTPSNTPRPTFTPYETITPFSIIPPTKTPKPTSTPKAQYGAVVTYIASTVIHPESGCNWLGVGGSIVNASNADVLQQIVVLRGTFDGKGIDMPTVSGLVRDYGQSGFEFNLGTVPMASTGKLYVQMFDQTTQLPISDKISINTYTDCSKNLVLVRFKARR